jgi:DHA1 family inner membrane transport protein
VLGAATFVVVPLLQTWLMAHVGQAAAGLIAAVNISVAGIAGALGAGLGGAVLAAGLGLAAIGSIAALPVLGATAVAFGLRRRSARVLCRD